MKSFKIVLKQQQRAVEMAQLVRVLPALAQTHVQFAAPILVSHP